MGESMDEQLGKFELILCFGSPMNSSWGIDALFFEGGGMAKIGLIGGGGCSFLVIGLGGEMIIGEYEGDGVMSLADGKSECHDIPKFPTLFCGKYSDKWMRCESLNEEST